MVQTRFGTQPGHQVMVSQGRAISAVARLIGVGEAHLATALSGRVRPNQTVRDRLPGFLGVPLDELFTEDALGPAVERLSSVS